MNESLARLIVIVVAESVRAHISHQSRKAGEGLADDVGWIPGGSCEVTADLRRPTWFQDVID